MNELVTVVITLAVVAVVIGAWFVGGAYGYQMGKERGRADLTKEIDQKLAERQNEENKRND